MCGRGACMVGDMHGEGYVWQGVCMVGGGMCGRGVHGGGMCGGVCMAGGMAGGMCGKGMHGRGHVWGGMSGFPLFRTDKIP